MLPIYCQAQLAVAGVWLPVKRLNNIYQLKKDSCNSPDEFPFKKIQFIDKNKVSLYSIGAGDPFFYNSKYSLSDLTWEITDTIISTSNFPINSKNVLIKIRKDTLYCYTITELDTIIQKFVRKYKNLSFKDYNETELGNLFINGKYKFKNGQNSVEFLTDGSIKESRGLQKNHIWKYVSYRFYSYPQSCSQNPNLEKIIKLTDSSKKTTLFVLKQEKNVFNFYKISKMKNRWQPETYSYSFSLTLIW